jgi:hypothetical protein
VQFLVDAKGFVYAILTLFGLVPLIVLCVNYVSFQTGRMNATDFIQKGTEAAVDIATPWWVPLIVGGGTVGAIILIVLVVLFGKGILNV